MSLRLAKVVNDEQSTLEPRSLGEIMVASRFGVKKVGTIM